MPEGLRFHDLRDHLASLLNAGGLDVRVVQHRLRHDSAKTTLDTRCQPDLQQSLPLRPASPVGVVPFRRPVAQWEAAVSWKKALLVPRVARLARRAPRDTAQRWNAYWGAVRATGPGGDVLWDSGSDREGQSYLARLRRHADPALPLVDVGCGNGRLTRLLAQHSSGALGVDLSPNAVARATAEATAEATARDSAGSAGPSGVAFRAVDMTAPGAGERLAAELGDANAFVRGVFHVLTGPARRALAANLHDLLGARGTLLLAETHFPGSPLDYLQHLGATPTHLPRPLERVLSAGLPRPSDFGPAQLAETFPSAAWVTVASGPAVIDAVPTRTPERLEPVPGYCAVLRTRRHTSPPSPGRPDVSGT